MSPIQRALTKSNNPFEPLKYREKARTNTSEGINERLGRIKEMYSEAQSGGREMLQYFLKDHHMKVYTQEEIDLINSLTEGGKLSLKHSANGNELTDLSERDLILLLPDLQGRDDLAKLNWIKELTKPYYLAGFTHLEPPKVGEDDLWIVKFDEEVGFTPLFCALYW